MGVAGIDVPEPRPSQCHSFMRWGLHGKQFVRYCLAGAFFFFFHLKNAGDIFGDKGKTEILDFHKIRKNFQSSFDGHDLV